MPESLNWQHIIIEAMVVLIPILVGQWIAHEAGKKDADRREQKREFIAQEYPHHAHGELEGTLKVEGIRYPKANGR